MMPEKTRLCRYKRINCASKLMKVERFYKTHPTISLIPLIDYHTSRNSCSGRTTGITTKRREDRSNRRGRFALGHRERSTWPSFKGNPMQNSSEPGGSEKSSSSPLLCPWCVHDNTHARARRDTYAWHPCMHAWSRVPQTLHARTNTDEWERFFFSFVKANPATFARGFCIYERWITGR